MAIQIQLRQGTTTEPNTFKGAVGEVTVDTTKDVPVVHDGVTVGGHPVAARANADGTISLIKKDGTSAGTINALGLFNNTLTSTNTNQALTAAQGKVLKDTLDTAVSSSFGVGQTMNTVNRSTGVEYTNNTPKTITIFFAVQVGTYGTSTAYCNTGSGDVSVGSVFGDVGSGGSVRGQLVIIAPPQAKYKVIGGSIVSSSELS